MVEILKEAGLGGRLGPETDEDINRFLAPFVTVATSLESLDKPVQLVHLRKKLLEQPVPAGHEVFFEKYSLKVHLERLAAQVRNRRLIEVVYAVAEDRPGTRHFPLYPPKAIMGIGVAAYFYLQDVQAIQTGLVPQKGVWDRVVTCCREYRPDFFDPLSLPATEETEEDPLEEELSLPLKMDAKGMENLCLYFSLMTKGIKYNGVDGHALEGGRINPIFVKRARWLYLITQGDIRANQNDDSEIDNRTFVQILDYLAYYFKRNKLTLGEVIARAEMLQEHG